MKFKYYFLPEMVLCGTCVKHNKKSRKLRPTGDVNDAVVTDFAVEFEMQCLECGGKGIVKMPIHTADEVKECP